MPMRATTVRFDASLWAMLEREARTQGVSAAQFVRDATILRIASVATQRGDDDMLMTVADLAATASGAAAAPLPSEPPAAVLDERRLAALHGSGLLAVQDDPAFDRLTRLASRLLGAPIALVSLVDRDRQVFASCIGLAEDAERGTPISHSFCQHAVAAREPLVVGDAREHSVLRSNPAIEDLGIIAYAGVPLIDPDGYALGTLCVADGRPRTWTREDVDLLTDLASSVLTEIKLRRATRTSAWPAPASGAGV
jgi:GAF domain-containing protein